MRHAAEIALLAYPDCQMSAVHGLTDLFRIASDWAPGDVCVRVGHWAASDEGIACGWDSHPGAPHAPDYVIVPPSLIMPDAMDAMPRELAWLAERHKAGARVCSVCAGAFLLAGTGLLDGRRATTHWAFARELGARFPMVRVADAHMLIDEGDVITAGGILAWTDLGLTLVDRLMGRAAMLATARFLLVDPPRATQRPFADFVPVLDHGDAAILRAQQAMEADPANADGLAGLARLAGLGERTFLRRFRAATGMRPTEYLQKVRVMRARAALEMGREPVDAIAWSVGYEDPAAFRKVFRRLTGITPTDYRTRFGTLA